MTANKSCKTEILSTFALCNTNVTAAVNENEAWFGWCGYRGVTLVTSNGNKIKTVDTGNDFVCDLATSQSGQLFVSSYRGHHVKKLNTDGKSFTDIYKSDARKETHGITVNHEDKVFVCVYELCSSCLSIIQLDMDGNVKHTIKYDVTHIKMSLKDHPVRIACSTNGHLVLVEPYQRVLVMDQTGQLEFTYTGQLEQQPFNPHYAVTDRYGQILISDCVNSKIHILDSDGNLMRFVLPDNDSIKYPLGMSIDQSNNLWLCSYGNEKVVIVKYTV